MKLRRIFFCAAMLLALILPMSVQRALAEDPNRLAQLKISVWPEFDQPTVLVMVDGTLADATKLPREISVLVPASAQGIIATYENANGTLAAEQTFKSEKQDDGQLRITYTTSAATYHLEDYDNALRGSPDKTLDFALTTPAPADKATLEFQQPLKATNFSLTPPTTNTRVESGFTYYLVDYSNVPAGQSLTAQAKYVKSDPNPSVQPTPNTAPVPAPAAATAGGNSTLSNIYIIFGIAILGGAILMGLVMFQRSRALAPPPLPARRPRRRARGAAPVRSGAQGEVFCTQCGASLSADDVFCRKCGAKRRAV